ncbi:amidohydrolase family protein [Streptomyces avermitilis]|uniref:amidohydrolase family protein n=1 Tax=Streptomyces avermitilis TaxID=33903 RepID=UPI0033D37069
MWVFNRTTLRYLGSDEVALLDVSLVNKIGMTRDDGLRRVAGHRPAPDLTDHGVVVAHCPGSNAKLGSGIAGLTVLLADSVAVGLGTDGPTSNDDLDLWEETRLAMTPSYDRDPLALSAKDVLLMAPRGGAATVGRPYIDTLGPGAWADMIHVGMYRPHFAAGLDVPDEQLLANPVWVACSRAGRDVWGAGEQVVADGEPLLADRAAAQQELASAAARILPVEPYGGLGGVRTGDPNRWGCHRMASAAYSQSRSAARGSRA